MSETGVRLMDLALKLLMFAVALGCSAATAYVWRNGNSKEDPSQWLFRGFFILISAVAWTLFTAFVIP